jgi:hypothetical protein
MMRVLLIVAFSLLSLAARAQQIGGGGGGSSTITAGTTAYSGTAGLLYGNGASLVQSLPGTFSAASGYSGNIFTLANDYQLAMQTVGDVNTPMLSMSVTSSAYNYGNMAEFYAIAGGINYLDTYIAGNGALYSAAYFVASGHTSGGPGFGRQMLLPNTYIPSMFACWSDITGPCYVARDNAGVAGEYSFMGLTSSGVTTLALDARNTQLVFGNQTVGSGQIFTGDTFLSRAAAANIRFGGADAASPVAQTHSFQNVLAGTSNTAGVNATFQASAGTGTGAGGSFLFQVAPAGTTGSTQNSFSTALTIAPTIVTLGSVTSTANAPQLVLAPASGTGWGLSSYYYGGGNLVFQSNNSGITGSWAYSAAVNGYGFEVPSTAGFCISSTTNPTAGPDACLWRASAGVATIGNGTQGDYSGTIQATHFTSGTSAGVSCAAGSVSLVTITITNGIVTHC